MEQEQPYNIRNIKEEDYRYINKWWKKKSIKRYTKLFNDNRLKPEKLYYSDILGMTWEQAKERYLNDVGR